MNPATCSISFWCAVLRAEETGIDNSRAPIKLYFTAAGTGAPSCVSPISSAICAVGADCAAAEAECRADTSSVLTIISGKEL